MQVRKNDEYLLLKKTFLKKIYLKVKKVPNNITPQQANIAEKIPVLINAVL